MRQGFLQSEGLVPTPDAFVPDVLLLLQELDQVLFLQGAFKIIHQLRDEEVQDAAGNCVTHVHFKHVEASHHVPFDILHFFLFLNINSAKINLTCMKLNFPKVTPWSLFCGTS